MDHLLSGQNQLDTSIHCSLKAISFGRAARTLLFGLLSMHVKWSPGEIYDKCTYIKNLRKVLTAMN
jgi:hypothetical protein